MDEETEVFMGSGNVFADLGRPDPEERQFKSLLAMQIREMIQQKGLTQTEAAQQIGLAAGDIAAIFRGRLSEFSIDQLFKCLNRLGRSVEVRISAKETQPEEAHMTVVMA